MDPGRLLIPDSSIPLKLKARCVYGPRIVTPETADAEPSPLSEAPSSPLSPRRRDDPRIPRRCTEDNVPGKTKTYSNKKSKIEASHEFRRKRGREVRELVDGDQVNMNKVPSVRVTQMCGA